MAISDLNDLFESVDGLTEDLMEYGIIAGSAVASHMAFNFVSGFAIAKIDEMKPDLLPSWFKSYVVPGIAIAGGAVAGGFGGKYVGRKAATGIAVGLMTAGITKLIRTLDTGSKISPFLSGSSVEESMMNGLADAGSFDRYLGRAPTTVESIGRAPTTVESVGGLGSYGGRLSATTVASIS